MPICTLDQVKAAARIDGAEFDDQITDNIATAQALIEHECGVAAGAFGTPPDAGVTRCAVALCVQMIHNPDHLGAFANRDDLRAVLTSALLDGARTWS